MFSERCTNAVASPFGVTGTLQRPQRAHNALENPKMLPQRPHSALFNTLCKRKTVAFFNGAETL